MNFVASHGQAHRGFAQANGQTHDLAQRVGPRKHDTFDMNRNALSAMQKQGG